MSRLQTMYIQSTDSDIDIERRLCEENIMIMIRNTLRKQIYNSRGHSTRSDPRVPVSFLIWTRQAELQATQRPQSMKFNIWLILHLFSIVSIYKKEKKKIHIHSYNWLEGCCFKQETRIKIKSKNLWYVCLCLIIRFFLPMQYEVWLYTKTELKTTFQYNN